STVSRKRKRPLLKGTSKVAVQRTATLASRNCVDCLPLKEPPCHAKRAEGCAEQHCRRAAVRNLLAAGRSKEGNMRDVLYRIVEGPRSRADERFIIRDTVKSVEHSRASDTAVFDQRAIESEAASSQIP